MTTHGTPTAYINGCRCPDCHKAAIRRQKVYRMLTGADGRNAPVRPLNVPRDEAVQHFAVLKASGWRVHDIALEVGLTRQHLSWTMTNKRHTKMRRTISDAILALEPLEPVTFDTVLVDRFVNGEADWRQLTRDERCEAARRMDRAGVSRNAIAALTHLNSRTLWAAFDAEEIAS